MHSRRSYRSISIERLSGTSETCWSLAAAAMLHYDRCSIRAELNKCVTIWRQSIV